MTLLSKVRYLSIIYLKFESPLRFEALHQMIGLGAEDR